MPTMSRHQAETVHVGSEHRDGRSVLAAVMRALAALALVTAVSVGCIPAPASDTSSAETSPTVIATASPIPTAPPVPLEPSVAPTMPGYHLVFDDEFIGPKLNRKKWTTSLPWGNTNAAEQQYYTPDALSQSGGVLTITASRQPTHGQPYASGVISSGGRFAFSYGYSELRAQVPPGTGLWSAFWLLSPVQQSNEEVDVLEVLGSDPEIMAGKPVVRGTRIPVDLVLKRLSEDLDLTTLFAAYPRLTREDVQACLAYANTVISGESLYPVTLQIQG